MVAGWYFLQKPAFPSLGTGETPTPTDPMQYVGEVSEPESSGAPQTTTKGGASERVVVTYTDSGYAPNPVNIKKGTTVTFVNESSQGMWSASAVHPTHQLLPGFDQLKSVSRGGTYEYAFEKVGTWKYHNHVAPTDIGTVVVTE